MLFNGGFTHYVIYILCLSQLAEALEANEEWDTYLPITVVVAVISVIFLLIIVFLSFLCGGCTGMEVSTESHPASGGTNKHDFSSPVVTDANTRVLMSTCTVPGDDPYNPSQQSQGLPYSLNPIVPSAPGFAGYQAVPTQDPSQGWGQPQGYGGSPGPNAHRPAVSSEPPPPTYNETIRGDNNLLWN